MSGCDRIGHWGDGYEPDWDLPPAAHEPELAPMSESQLNFRPAIDPLYDVVLRGFGAEPHGPPPDYASYIQSREWRERRKAALYLCNRRCKDCQRDGQDHVRLEVHHLSYANLGHEADADLVVLCGSCHRRRHGIEA